MKAEIFNYSGFIKETDPHKLKDKFSELLYLSEFDVLGFQEHFFTPIGYTALWLLGESHFAIHTFPEQGKTYIELSSCNEAKKVFFVANI
jgi:S-adenosylmethionine/arginine decarboxylase-like enzyme